MHLVLGSEGSHRTEDCNIFSEVGHQQAGTSQEKKEGGTWPTTFENWNAGSKVRFLKFNQKID